MTSIASLAYPRTVSIVRPNSSVTVGATGFGGIDPNNNSETTTFTGLPANISYERVGRNSNANLPTDSRKSAWMITLPAGAVAVGAILENDIVVDETGKRYQIYSADWQILGYALHAELLIV